MKKTKEMLNKSPRKNLGYALPIEVFFGKKGWSENCILNLNLQYNISTILFGSGHKL